MNNNMKYLSLFSGIGGFEKGIEQAYENKKISEPIRTVNKVGSVRQEGDQSNDNNSNGDGGRPCSNDNKQAYEKSKLVESTTSKTSESSLSESQSRGWFGEYATCIGYSEIDKYAAQIYDKQFNHKNYGDITKINSNELPDFDCLVGGFPCQSFSIAGRRLGFNDTRGTLFFDIARILSYKRPRNLVLENVKGLLSHDKGKTFTTILGVLSDLGYFVEWQVLNSKNFGVPQNRERVFIIGYLGGDPGQKVFPITGTTKNNIKVVGELNSETWKKRHECIRRVHDTNGISPTIPTGTGGGVMNKIIQPVLTPARMKKRQNGRRIKDNGEPSFTLTGQDQHGVLVGRKAKPKKTDIASTLMARDYKGIGNQATNAVMEDARIRRLTPLECERLQGFPDGWTEVLSDTQRYKTLGNAVTVNVIEYIFSKLII